MKQLLITIAAVVLVGCGESKQSATALESKPVEPVAEVPAQPPPPIDAKPDEPVAEASQPEPPTAKASDISTHLAASLGDIETVKQHLAAGTDVNAKGSMNGWTPLHYAALDSHKEIAELLISKGADVNAKNYIGETPLIMASGMHHKEVVELLIAKGADVNAKIVDGRTPLHLTSNKEIAELLIAKGADVNAKDEDGETPLDRAISSSRFYVTDPLRIATEEFIELLRKHGGKTGEELKAEGI